MSKNEIDLLSDDYTIITWPGSKLHSQRFPYLVVKIGFGMYAPVAIPVEILSAEVSAVTDWFVGFVTKYGFEATVVTDKNRAFYLKANGEPRGITNPPHGGTVVNWQKWLEGKIGSVDYEGGKKMIYAIGEGEDENVYVSASEGIPREDLLAKRKELRDEKVRQTQFAFCPKPLEIKDRPELSAFSYNVMFHTILDSETMTTALYYPELESYKENEETMELRYRNEHNNKYWLEITYSTANG